ncbi:MAG: DNA-binding response regulator [Bacilli bacterium]|nr:DNA-binding response regulator [Bacilli bacterium]
MKILIAEDDLSVCEMLRLFMQKEPFTVTYAHHGLTAEQHFQQEAWDLIILDWMLPGKDGITLCREFRQAKNTPIILLTAKDGEQDRILGLELGADDYVTKPFSPMELIARIKAVTRRYKGNSQEDRTDPFPSIDAAILRYQGIIINLTSRSVSINDHSISNLTPKEFDLFCLFVKYPKRVFTREQLLESIWGFDYFGEERTVDVHIKRLRNKISTPEHPFIGTVWGIGYKLEE